MVAKQRERIVLSLGGSLVCPGATLDVNFLSKFSKFVRKLLTEKAGLQVFIVVGGGGIARHYRDAGRAVLGRKMPKEDLDWLGIHTTRLNAHLLRTIFRTIAHPRIIKHYDALPTADERVVIGSGWQPGWSTDYDAVLICKHYSVDTVINLSNIDQVYDRDPNKHRDAKPLDYMAWKDFRAIVGNKWIPGMNAPFDPIAAKEAAGLHLKVVVLRGGNWKNLEHYFQGKEFVGTTIGPA